ncbi:mismatch-specific DNA-glycosylase [Lacisediminihabitans changchengi]|uniref:Mismatch-specific DNA-glycosylase n=1 Tax=Lacisediminihabitans changchengi TaxID=2787634 RepID=A0A934SHD9_9MICO|nr:mismatch-specific DNA-glycosylase [Lacisediminihabitans changchengi]MBK4346671.1 mismatch-specific DNA-glycosylase [Lacisediminihabitans changchengi]
MGFSQADLQAYRGGTLPDLISHHLRLLIVGINPGLLTIAVQAHFARRGNRFYPALYGAGITDHVIDASAGLKPDDARHLDERGIGITSIVPAATARASELTAAQLRDGGIALRARVAELRPAVVAFLGITAYRIAFDEPHAQVGRQEQRWGSSQLWVVPNPSGLNAHSSLSDLASAYRAVAVAAGIETYPTHDEA